ncbi:uncharacterized protein [Physcomitrium patens]|uniref:uncharacterized protein isoform X2 n=1 Tax=Physcomitrium patens TaxID=3218 RepID=UPI000D16696A|nr:GATA zinc finger domain-containing protein 15-like [Physcomitrium patens]|eukprot:XP_024370189.1 GATA zinc finger domain-containing protein 15-like [Physcomitrella patens]
MEYPSNSIQKEQNVQLQQAEIQKNPMTNLVEVPQNNQSPLLQELILQAISKNHADMFQNHQKQQAIQLQQRQLQNLMSKSIERCKDRHNSQHQLDLSRKNSQTNPINMNETDIQNMFNVPQNIQNSNDTILEITDFSIDRNYSANNSQENENYGKSKSYPTTSSQNTSDRFFKSKSAVDNNNNNNNNHNDDIYNMNGCLNSKNNNNNYNSMPHDQNVVSGTNNPPNVSYHLQRPSFPTNDMNNFNESLEVFTPINNSNFHQQNIFMPNLNTSDVSNTMSNFQDIPQLKQQLNSNHGFHNHQILTHNMYNVTQDQRLDLNQNPNHGFYNHQILTHNMQNVTQEQRLDLHQNFKRSNNPTSSCQSASQEQDIVRNLSPERICKCSYIPQEGIHEQRSFCTSVSPNMSNLHENNSQSYFQENPSFNLKNLQNMTIVESPNNLQANSPTLTNSLQCTSNEIPNPIGKCSQGLLPIVNINFSPILYNSPSILPTTPNCESEAYELCTPMNILNPKSFENIDFSSVDSKYSNSNLDQNDIMQNYKTCGSQITSSQQHDNLQISNNSMPQPSNYKKNNMIVQTKILKDQGCDVLEYDVRNSLTNMHAKIQNLELSQSQTCQSCFQNVQVPTTNGPIWIQNTILIPSQKFGCHNITSLLLQHLKTDLSTFKCGLAHIYSQSANASLTIIEDCDPRAFEDFEIYLDMSASIKRTSSSRNRREDEILPHIKTKLLGCSLVIPITDGCLSLGKWQVRIVHNGHLLV